MKDLKQFIKTTIREFLNETLKSDKSVQNKFIDDLRVQDVFFKDYDNSQVQDFLDYKRGDTLDKINALSIGESIKTHLYTPIVGYSRKVIITNTINGYEVIADMSLKDVPSYDIDYNQLINGIIKTFDGKTDLEHLKDYHIEIENYISDKATTKIFNRNVD
jgi:hypothetical protein